MDAILQEERAALASGVIPAQPPAVWWMQWYFAILCVLSGVMSVIRMLEVLWGDEDPLAVAVAAAALGSMSVAFAVLTRKEYLRVNLYKIWMAWRAGRSTSV